MAIVKMKHLQVLALERDHDAILRRLQHMGCLEISEPDIQALPDTLRRCDTAAADLLARQRQLQSAIDILRRTAPPQKTGLLTPRPRISEREYLDEAALASELETAQHINELAADVNRLTAKETQLRSEQAALTPWRSLDIPLELTETRWCDITTGTLPPFAVWEEIQGTLSQQVPESEAYLLYADRQQQGILLLTHKAVTAQALELLRSFGFSGGQLKGRHGTPEENLTALADSLRQTAAEKDAALIENELVWLLAEPAADADWDWVKPGLVSWDWWNGMRLTGVDFRAGRNTESYRYYIDFAARYGIPYIIMDEGWSASTTDVFHPNPDLDLQELIAYGRERNVQIVLWLTWLAVEKDMDRLFAMLEEWGIPGVKIDFMDRSDQWMVGYYERVMKCAARHRLFVDMHGSYTPKGLYRTYPNLLTYEGVLGMEQGARCKPENSNWLPFIRNAVAPLDFTPGSMFSAQPEDNRSTGANPMGTGTRAYQMALYVVFESPLQMLADNPVLYRREHPCTEFLAAVPTTWDSLRVLHAACGREVVVARRKGDKWYVGGITNDRPYTTEIALDFLPAGRTFTMTSFEDGVNADLQATDYRKRVREVDASTVVKVEMVRNGGWAAVIE